MESWLDTKEFLDAVRNLENALNEGDPHFIRNAAEAVIAKRDQLFAAAKDIAAAMMLKREW